MIEEASKILWANLTRTHFFLIPDDQKLSPGNFVLRDLTGHQIEVDPGAIKTFAVTQDQAKAWLSSQQDDTIQSAQRAVYKYLNGELDSNEAPAKDSAEDSSKDAAGPGVRLFSALTGESTKAIQTDLEASLRGFRKLGFDFKEWAADYFSADENKRESAKQRLQKLRETLHEHGIGNPPAEPSAPPPETPRPRVEDISSKAAGDRNSANPAPDPGEVFRSRLKKILEGAVGRLEELSQEVLPKNDKKKPSSD